MNANIVCIFLMKLQNPESRTSSEDIHDEFGSGDCPSHAFGYDARRGERPDLSLAAGAVILLKLC